MKSVITATPEQIERAWEELTDWQKEQVILAKALKKSLYVTLLDVGEFKVLYDLSLYQ